VTSHPTAEWIASANYEAPRYLIRDRDKIYGVAVTRRLPAMRIRDKPVAPGSPWQNGFVERSDASVLTISSHWVSSICADS
jgi:hypothetical protein